jgi:hypothetical protein
VDAFNGFLDGLPDRGRTARILAGLGLILLALIALVVLNLSLRAWGLWGDLAFAVTVTTIVLWVLIQTTRPLLRRGRFRAFPRALAAAVTALVGVPVAAVTSPAGAILLGAPFVGWMALLLVRLRGEVRVRAPRDWPQALAYVPLPRLWPAALTGVALVLLFVALRPPLSPADTVPRAVPAAELNDADAELAAQFRPLLFFDTGEQRYPLDIEAAIEDGRIRMCRRGVSGDDCNELETAADIDDSFEYLDVADAPPPRRGGDDRSAYYYHVVPGAGARIYVDYWWFYSRNPSPVADDVFCGPGLRTPPFTCQEHAGDWEGLTVVVEPCQAVSDICVEAGGSLLEPVAVRYPQHNRVEQHGWSELVERWRNLPRPTNSTLGPVWDEFVLPTAAEHGPHPLVFVARNSHASYPVPCLRECKQESGGLPEGRFDAGQPWTHNTDCNDCLKPLPLTKAGAPALWNAFSGPWGAQRCILGGAYCDLSAAPRGPSHQKRYRNPAGDRE